MKTQREINLFNALFEHYGNEYETWEAVKIAIFMNYTPAQVIKVY